MALPRTQQVALRLDLDLTAPVYALAALNGRIARLWAVKEGALSAQSVVTFALKQPGGSFVNITGGALTIVTAGAAGDTAFQIPTDLNVVVPGTVIRATSDGVPTTVFATLVVEIYISKNYRYA